MLHTLSGALPFLFCYSGFLFIIALGVINLAGWRKHASKKRKCAFCAFSLGLKNDDYALGRQPLALGGGGGKVPKIQTKRSKGTCLKDFDEVWLRIVSSQGAIK